MTSTMTAVTEPPAIDLDALRRVVSGVGDVEINFPSDEIISASAGLRLAVDREFLHSLKFSAQFLLSISLPAFNHEALYSAAQAGAIVAACEELQRRVQMQAEGIAKLEAGTVHSSVKEWSDVVLNALQTVFQHAENVRWSAMNAEAEAEIEAGKGKGKGKSFGSMDAALVYLARMR